MIFQLFINHLYSKWILFTIEIFLKLTLFYHPIASTCNFSEKYNFNEIDLIPAIALISL